MDKTFKMTAKTMYGLEDVLAKEIESLGGQDIDILKRAVSFTGDNRCMYRMNYCLRTALAILKPVLSFTANNEDMLYAKIKNFPWERHLNPDGTLYIDCSTSSKVFNHSLYVAQKCKDAICDRMREKFSRRPSVDRDNPDLKLDIHIGERKQSDGKVYNEVLVSFNSSGESLFKRGYRQKTGEAPLNEVTAAGLIQLSGWQKDCNFLDPMCGSGTLAIEAAMYAMDIPAQYYRKGFAFEHWSDFNSAIFKEEKEAANANIKEFDYEIWASDISQEALSRAELNIQKARLQYDINLFRSPMEEGKKPEGRTLVIMNPPYGERLEVDDIIALYERVGDTFKHHFTGDTAWVISSDIFALKRIGLRPSKKMIIYNGNLECGFYKFTMY